MGAERWTPQFTADTQEIQSGRLVLVWRPWHSAEGITIVTDSKGEVKK